MLLREDRRLSNLDDGLGARAQLILFAASLHPLRAYWRERGVRWVCRECGAEDDRAWRFCAQYARDVCLSRV